MKRTCAFILSILAISAFCGNLSFAESQQEAGAFRVWLENGPRRKMEKILAYYDFQASSPFEKDSCQTSRRYSARNGGDAVIVTNSCKYEVRLVLNKDDAGWPAIRGIFSNDGLAFDAFAGTQCAAGSYFSEGGVNGVINKANNCLAACGKSADKILFICSLSGM